MVAYTAYVNSGDVYFYLREQSVKCVVYLWHQRECDGTFSLEELRRVDDQKRVLKS